MLRPPAVKVDWRRARRRFSQTCREPSTAPKLLKGRKEVRRRPRCHRRDGLQEDAVDLGLEHEVATHVASVEKRYPGKPRRRAHHDRVRARERAVVTPHSFRRGRYPHLLEAQKVDYRSYPAAVRIHGLEVEATIRGRHRTAHA